MIGRSVQPLGDAALSIELTPTFSMEASVQAAALAAAIRQAPPPGLRDVLVCGAGVTIHFDPLLTDAAQVMQGIEAISAEVEPQPPDAPAIVIPVRYGGEDGPDLEDVARRCGMSPVEVVARHSAVTYRVIMMGFVPGFGYLWPLDERLRLPRRPSPRTHVPAGSVAIAGPQTAVYPSATPGGWHLIGRTDLHLVDFTREEPFLLETGRLVRFVPQ
ncbi:MAG TPA: 5-oxoprolinase subunit PxpB [Vicinamibacterales bacterium]